MGSVGGNDPGTSLPKVEESFFFSTYFSDKVGEITDRGCPEAYVPLLKWTQGLRLFDFRFVFVPICVSKNHWVLVVFVNLDNFKAYWEDTAGTTRAPYMLVMDSNAEPTKPSAGVQRVARNLRDYFRQEWLSHECNQNESEGFKAFTDAFLGDTPPLCVSVMPLVYLKVPQQTNDVDCGLYCAQFVEDILLRWKEMSEVSAAEIEDQGSALGGFNHAMYTPSEISMKRYAFASLVYYLRDE